MDQNAPLPTLFVSHGSPTVLTDDDAAHHFLAGLGGQLPRPAQILMISAHWESSKPAVSGVVKPETIHDFGGFARALYEIRYPAPGAPELAGRVAELLDEAGFSVGVDGGRGLDHGAWVPLKLMYGTADIPVTQLSIQPRQGPEYHYRLGQALAPLREEGVLIVGSGAMTHNLSEVFRGGMDHDSAVPAWVTAFSNWMADALLQGRIEDVLDYRTRAPYAEANHPTEDHILPLFVALGAAGEDAAAQRLHASYTFGVLAMDAYAFS